MKFRPLTWRNSHPYFLCDRVEDMTHPQKKIDNPICDRTVAFYGYLRGTHLKSDMKIHIPGCGDFFTDSITELADPCPLPDKKKRQMISEKEKLIYCPMGDVGNITFDKDATYIDIADHKVSFTKLEDEEEDDDEDLGQGEKMVRSLQDTSVGIDERLKDSKISIFAGSKPISSSVHSRRPVSFATADPDFGDDDDEDDDNEENGDDNNEEDEEEFEKRIARRKSFENENVNEEIVYDEDDGDDITEFYRTNKSKFNFGDEDEEEDDESDEDNSQKLSPRKGSSIADKMKFTAEKFFKNRVPSIMEVVYNTKTSNSDSDDDEDEGELLKLVKEKTQAVSSADQIDTSKSISASLRPWKDNADVCFSSFIYLLCYYYYYYYYYY